MSGNSPKFIEHARKSVPYTIYDTKWIPESKKFVGVGAHPRTTGAIHIYDLNNGEIKEVSSVEKKIAFKCSTFGASLLPSRNLATGNWDGDLSIWDIEKLSNPIYNTRGHKDIINSIDAIGGLGIGGGAPEIATASKDGAVRIWDPRQKDKPVASLEPAPDSTKRDCWSARFGGSYGDSQRSVIAGYDSGDLKLWDLKMNKVVWETHCPKGVVYAGFDRSDIQMNKLLVAGLSGLVRVYDMTTYNEKRGGYPFAKDTSDDVTVWFARPLPQNSDLFSIGSGNNLKLLKYNYPAERVKVDEEDKSKYGVAGSVSILADCPMAEQPVSTLDWSPTKRGLCVFGAFDQTIRVGIVTGLNHYK